MVFTIITIYCFGTITGIILSMAVWYREELKAVENGREEEN